MFKKNWLLIIGLLALLSTAAWSQVSISGKSILSGKTSVALPTSTSVVQQPTNTLNTLTSNNTAACATQSYCSKAFAGLGSNTSDSGLETPEPDPAPGNVSVLDLHKLLPAGTKVLAHFMGWFSVGTSGHNQTQYNSNDSNTVAAQMNDMIARGFDGLVIDWYSSLDSTIDGTTKKVNANLGPRCSSAQNCPLEFAIMEDQGAIFHSSDHNCSSSDHTCIVNAWETDLCYMNATYFGSNAYLKVNPSTHAWAAGTDPVVFTFPPSAGWSSSDLSTVSTFAQNLSTNCTGVGHGVANGPVLIVDQDTPGFSAPFNGAFSWVSPSSWSASNQFLIDGGNSVYHESFYDNCNTHTGQICVGSAKKGFDDNNATWGSNRVVAQECGQTWMSTLRKAVTFTGSNLTLQIPTWNDYEEGTEIETGIDNCYRVLPPTMSGTVLNWTATTNDINYAPVDSNGMPTNGTADHWTIWYCDDANNCNLAVDNIPVADHSIDLNQQVIGIPSGTWRMYVQLVGQPDIMNQMSSSYASYNTSTAVNVSVSPTTATVQTGSTQQFTATDSSTSGVTWSVNSIAGGNSTVGTITSAGFYTAPAAVPSPATVTVTATDAVITTASASATVTIQAPSSGVISSYTTAFPAPPAPENPISEGGNWIAGGSQFPAGYPGSHAMQTAAGEIYGTQTGTAGCSVGSLSVCDDSAAALTGNWSPDQEITSTADIKSYSSSTEIEQHLRSQIPFGKAQLYEVDIRAAGSVSSAFINIARWNGDGTFDTLCVNNGTQYAVLTGDVVHSTITGNNGTDGTVTIKVYVNSNLTVTCQDASSKAILTGNPGLGAYQNLGIPGSAEPNFGWSNVTAKSDPVSGGGSGGGGSTTYSYTNQPPDTFYPYADGANMYDVPLPVDKMSHLAVPSNYGITGYTSDQIAQAALTADGTVGVPNTGTSPQTNAIYFGGWIGLDSPASNKTPGQNDNSSQWWFSSPTDPWYRLQSANGTTANVVIRAPSGAEGSHLGAVGSVDDSNIGIIDQQQGLWVTMFGALSNPITLPAPNGCGSSPATACVYKVVNDVVAGVIGSSPDYGTSLTTVTINGISELIGGNGSDLGSGPYSDKPQDLETTYNEFMGGLIAHMMSGGIDCVSSQHHLVFPANNGALQCKGTAGSYGLPHGGVNMPPNGALLFCDYTDAQIAAMGLDTLQKTVLTALCHYGTFPTVTTGSAVGGALEASTEGKEGGLGYFKTQGVQHPFYSWAANQHIGATGGGTLTANRLLVSQFCCGTNNSPPTSQYRMVASTFWGIPLMTCSTAGDSGCSTRKDTSGRACATGSGCDVTGHFHWIDPCVLSGLAGVTGSGVPTPCVGNAHISLVGSGSGTITATIGGSPVPVNCDHVTSCNLSYANGTVITFTASPLAGDTFSGWSGACSGTGPCTVTVNGSSGVVKLTATFGIQQIG